jgi:glycosyltransferase involved in cell wall biosynthesis
MIVLLPVYRPGQHLHELVEELRGRAPVLVVDDGSGPEASEVLGGLGCEVLRQPTNRGKGVALKAGLTRVRKIFPGHDVVTADADGQHSAGDIVRVGERVAATGQIVFGVRRFDTGTVPARSRFGNTLTRLLFRAATGRDVRDTQTGLRGYPAQTLPWLLEIPGDRFEYEMNVLLRAARDGRPLDQVTIATTYLAGNASSHFGSLSDSLQIYRSLLRFALHRGKA